MEAQEVCRGLESLDHSRMHPLCGSVIDSGQAPSFYFELAWLDTYTCAARFLLCNDLTQTIQPHTILRFFHGPFWICMATRQFSVIQHPLDGMTQQAKVTVVRLWRRRTAPEEAIQPSVLASGWNARSGPLALLDCCCIADLESERRKLKNCSTFLTNPASLSIVVTLW